MVVGRTWALLHTLVGGTLALQVACSTAPSSARQPQSSGGLSGHGNLALAALRATTIAAIRQPVTTTKLGLAMLWHRPREVIRRLLPQVGNPQAVLAAAPGSREFETLLDRKHFPRTEAGTLTWLIDGAGFFPELDHQIAAARQSIKLQTFIFDNDDIAVRYADALKRRSNMLSVHVLFDDLGSTFASTSAPLTLGPRGFVPPLDMHTYLRDHSQLRARRILTPWLAADHTKLLVFDKRTAFIGGMNIGREYYSEWHDLMLRVEGPIVGSLTREFNRAWRKAGPWGDFALVRTPALLRRARPVTAGIPLRVLRTDPAEGRHEILNAMLLAIGGARQRVWIETPYFTSGEVARACEAAARRGVDVRVILPANGDSAVMNAANLATANGLLKAGARVFKYPQMSHAKVMICDAWACVGSANLDTLSLRINRELNLAFATPAAVQECANRVFVTDFRRSRRIRLEDTQAFVNRLAGGIADQL